MATHRSSQESINKIAKAARTLFAKKGYSNASLEEIATQAGFTKGAVYHFFRSKEALLLSILQDIEERSIAHSEEVLKSLGDAPALEKLIRFISAQSQWGIRNPHDLAILIRLSVELPSQKSAVAERVRRIYTRLAEAQTKLFEDGVASGEFPKDLPIADVVTLLTALHDGNMLVWYRNSRNKAIGHQLVVTTQNAVRMVTRRML